MVRFLAICFVLLARVAGAVAQQSPVQIDSISLFDAARQRQIPIVLYQAAMLSRQTNKPKLAILSHGYGGHNTDYSFIAGALVKLGYLVASVQHDLPGDEPIPTTGNLRETRRPNWERGVQTILFVSQALQRKQPTLDVDNLLLVGHSNGGDIAMLFADKYPAQVANVVSLDNRRMPLPRRKRPRLLSIRSSDQVADPGVLPTLGEQQQFGITIVQLPVRHNDMWDGASDEQKRAMTEVITHFLIPYYRRSATVFQA